MYQDNRIGIDIGGTATRIGIFAAATMPAFSLIARFPTETEYASEIARISEHISAIAGPIASIGVSVGARVARDGSAVAVAPNLRDYEGRPIRTDLMRQVGCEVSMAHDTVCGLLAERIFGALRDADRCGYLTLSTGTGGAVYLGNGGAGLYVSIEFAHQILDGNSRVCLCGQTGCLETYTGGKQIQLLSGAAPEDIIDPTIWATFADKLALGLVNLAQLTRVERIAVSGAIALNRPELLPALQARLDGLSRGMAMTLVPARLGADAPLVGAAWLPEVAVEMLVC